MSRISDNGLPRSVPTLADVPSSAYNGYIVLVEATGSLYVYTGAGYSKITTTAEAGVGEGADEGDGPEI
jgi:hypothetical protein